MARIPYPDLDMIDDPEILDILDRARRVGTPRPETQAIRSHVPAVVKSFGKAWQETFVDGVVDHGLKELCRVYVTKTVDCGYCAAQRSVGAGTPEEKYDDLLQFEKSDRYNDREKAALRYTDAIVWNADFADDAMWDALHEHFAPHHYRGEWFSPTCAAAVRCILADGAWAGHPPGTTTPT